MGLAFESSIDQGSVEVELAGVLGLELPSLEFDDEVAKLLDVEEEQVDVEIVPVDLEVNCRPTNAKPCPSSVSVSVMRSVRACSRSRSAT